jgi:hypothetical protein
MARSIRQDLNDLLLYRNGTPDSGKAWKNVGCGIVAYWMIAMPAVVWADWVASIAIASVLVAPDVVMKIVTLRTGGTTTSTSTQTTEVTK